MADIIIGISDDSTTSEMTAAVETSYNINVEDDITTSESLTEMDNIFISQVENVTTSESLGEIQNDLISGVETTTVTDFVGFYPDLVFAHDAVSQIKILNPFNPFIGEDIAVNEQVQVTCPPAPFAKVWNNIIRIIINNF